MFGRKLQTRLPMLHKDRRPAQENKIQAHDAKAKLRQKHYKDNKSNVRPHDIEVGDKVLLLQNKTKSKPQYDPDPYTVTKVQGSHITARRREKVRTRDSKKFKKILATAGIAPSKYNGARWPHSLYHDDWERTWTRR